MCKFSSKSEGVPFQPLGDLTWNDPSVSNHNTRNKSKLRQPRSNCEYMYRYINFSDVYIWNQIQDHINPGTPEYRNTYKKTFFVTYL